jgi:hypothetical protein
MYTGSDITALRPVGLATARVALHRGAHSRGYKLSRERRSQVSCEWWWWCVVSIEVGSSCCGLITPLDVAPASHFIASKGRSRVTFVVKG